MAPVRLFDADAAPTSARQQELPIRYYGQIPFWPKGLLTDAEKVVMDALCKLNRTGADSISPTNSEIGEIAEKHPSNISAHLASLAEKGEIKLTGQGKDRKIWFMFDLKGRKQPSPSHEGNLSQDAKATLAVPRRQPSPRREGPINTEREKIQNAREIADAGHGRPSTTPAEEPEQTPQRLTDSERAELLAIVASGQKDGAFYFAKMRLTLDTAQNETPGPSPNSPGASPKNSVFNMT